MAEHKDIKPWQKHLVEKIMGTSFTDMPAPRYEVYEHNGVYSLMKVFWNGSNVLLSEYKTKEEAEAMQKLAQYSE